MRHPDLQVPGSCSLLSLAPGFSLGFLNAGMESKSLCLESFQSHHTVGRSSLGAPEGSCLFNLLGHIPTANVNFCEVLWGFCWGAMGSLWGVFVVD